jgi:hypothetical protein
VAAVAVEAVAALELETTEALAVSVLYWFIGKRRINGYICSNSK